MVAANERLMVKGTAMLAAATAIAFSGQAAIRPPAVPLVSVEQPCDLLRVAHVVLVRVPEYRPETMGVADVDFAAALPAERADPSAVCSGLHAEHGATVAPEQRLQVFLCVRNPPLEHDVRLVVESDDGVHFIPQIDTDYGTITHGLAPVCEQPSG